MATRNKLVYSVLEKVKVLSDDQAFNNLPIDYVRFLVDSKREYLINQKFSDYRRVLPDNLKQTIEFEMIREERVLGLPGDYVLVSKEPLPPLVYIERLINSTILSGRDFMESYLNLVPYERFIYTGKDRWLKNQVYGAFRDGRLYLKSGNFREKGGIILNLTGIFSNPEEAYKMSLRYDPNISFEDIEYPLTDTLGDVVVNMILDDFLKTVQLKEDVRNNSSAD